MADQNNGEFEVGYKGISLRIKSSQIILLLCLIGLFVLIFTSGSMFAKELQSVRAEHARILADHKYLYDVLVDHFDAMLYLMSLPESERPKLRMPAALAQRIAIQQGLE